MSLTRLLFKSLAWLIACSAGVVVLALGYTVYVVESFDTETLPARYGEVDAKLYVQEGAARPLLVGLGGAEGGNAWASQRWKAQRDRFEQAGYAFLALGYFGLPNTPQTLDRIALEGIHRAITQAQSNPAVSDQCVVILGGSKGAELALALASHYPDIDAVVALAPADTVFPAHTDAMNTSSWALEGEPLPFVPIPWAATWDLIRGDLLAVMERALSDKDGVAAAAIAVERIQGPVLLISAMGDEMWPATQMADRMIARLEQNGFRFPHRHLAVEGGHAAVLDQFAEVETFLQSEVAAQPDCATALATDSASRSDRFDHPDP